MSELRLDPFSRRWVVIASERSRRPRPLVEVEHRHADGPCPFCPGHEDFTPQAIREQWSHDGRWLLRVIPNLFPALSVDAPEPEADPGLTAGRPGLGAHEVVVHSPDHHRDLDRLPLDDVHRVVAAWVERSADLQRDRRLHQVVVFQNHGALAGATLAHPHSQVLATPMIPRTVADELDASRAHLSEHGCPLLDAVVAEERAAGERIILDEPEWVVWAPWASRMPFELCIAPQPSEPHFARLGQARQRSLADVLSRTLRMLSRAGGRPAWNLFVHTAPNPTRFGATPQEVAEEQAAFRWRLVIVPRTTWLGGFEFAASPINPTPPEEVAEAMRAAAEVLGIG